MNRIRLILTTVMTIAILAPMSFAAAVQPGVITPPISMDRRGAFQHGLEVMVDGEYWFFAGPPDAPNGARDIPGHYWVQAGKNRLVGKHYNTGPFGAPKWWSSDADDGELLYIVIAKIDIWTPELAEKYAAKGYVHYHELLNVDDGTLHPTKVVWLKHHAVGFFNFDGGPHPEFAHYVTPGVDYDFINNYMMPYNP